MRDLVLTNESCHCYINTAVIAIFCALMECGDQVMQLELWAPLLAQAGPVNIARLSDWQQPLRLWRRRLDRQEDASEFMTCLMRALGPTSLEGRWEARLLQRDGARVLDSGGFLSPIRLMLQPDEDQVNIQILIDRWCEQAQKHAITEQPAILSVMIDRFQQIGGRLGKHEAGITDWHADVMLPVFTHNLECDYALYKFCSAVHHAGAGLDCGHYTCVSKAPGARRDFLFHDDNVVPIPLDAHRLCSLDLQRQVYVILYVKCF